MGSFTFGSADVSTCLEHGENLRIHLNESVLLIKEALVSDRNLSMDPSFEWLTHNGIDYVDYVLSWKLCNFTLLWKSLGYIRMGGGEAQEVVHS